MAETAQRPHLRLDAAIGVRRPLAEPRVAGHDGVRNDRARVEQVHPLPDIGVFAANAVQVRPGALGTPQKGPVIGGLPRLGVRSVTSDLRQQGAHLLRMAGAAALPDVEIASGQLHRAVGLGARPRRHQIILQDARQHLHQAADGGDEQDAEDQQAAVALQLSVQFNRVHGWLDPAAGGDTATVRRPLPVMVRLNAISRAPPRKISPARKRRA